MAEVSWEPLVYLDANSFIDAYEGEPRVSEPAKSLLDKLRKQPGTAVTCELSLAEVLVRPEAERNLIRKRAYLDLIIWSRFVSLVPITRNLLLETAKLRAVHRTKLRLADSIHLATVIRTRCRTFVSRDGRIMPPLGMRQMQLDRDGVDAVMQTLK